jgi:hypothetical protein
MEDTGSNEFALESILQLPEVRLVCEDAQVEGLASSAERAGGPFNKLREVKEERCLDFVLCGCGLGAS